MEHEIYQLQFDLLTKTLGFIIVQINHSLDYLNLNLNVSYFYIHVTLYCQKLNNLGVLIFVNF